MLQLDEKTMAVRNIVSKLGLFLLGSFFLLIAMGCIAYDAMQNGNITEKSVTEIAQQIALLMTFITFLLIAKKNKEFKNGAILIAGFFCTLFIRELDFFLDKIHHGIWIYPAIITVIVSVSIALKNGRDNLIIQLSNLLKLKNANSMILFIAILFVFTRLFGTGDLWTTIMADDYIRSVKNVAEEGSELMSYMMILLSSMLMKSEIDEKDKERNIIKIEMP